MIGRRLEDEVRELRRRVSLLEDALARHGIVVSEDPSKLERMPAPQGGASTSQGPMRAVQGAPSRDEPRRTGSFEARVGSQWFNRIGIIAVLVGVSWFLKLAVDRHWIAPTLRVLLGFTAGAGLVLWSERFRRKGFAAFSYSLNSVGSGVLYLTLWAGFALFGVIPAHLAFAGMVAVTAVNGYLAWRQNAELLALYAIAGGLTIPALMSTGDNPAVLLFSYLLLLDGATLALVVGRSWPRLLFASFIGTAVYATWWYVRWYSPGQFAMALAFFLLLFALFALGPELLKAAPASLFVLPRGSREPTRWNRIASALLPVANAGWAFVGIDALLRSRAMTWAEPWLAVTFAALYLGLARLARGEELPDRSLLAQVHLVTGITFVTVAIPLAFSGHWMTIGWLAEGGGLLWVAMRTRTALARLLGVISLCLAAVVLPTLRLPAHSTPVFNSRFVTYLFAFLVLGLAAWLSSQAMAHDLPEEARRTWRGIGLSAALVANLVALAGVLLEIHAYWAGKTLQGQAALAEARTYAQFSYSAACMLCGAILLAAGFWRESAFLRWQGLVILAVSVAKVFLVDMSQVSQGYRVLSFLGLGGLLLGVSFVYQRDWLGLRSRGPS